MTKDEPNLFGVHNPRKKRETPNAPNGAMQRLIGQYRDGYQLRFNEPPVFTPRDAKLLKNLVLQFGEQTVQSRLAAYLKWDDRFAEESGYSVPTFYASWPRLTALEKRKAPATRVPDADKTRAYIERSRRAATGNNGKPE